MELLGLQAIFLGDESFPSHVSRLEMEADIETELSQCSKVYLLGLRGSVHLLQDILDLSPLVGA